MLASNSAIPTPHREDNALVDKISGWPSAGALAQRPQTTLPSTNIPLFYQRPISGKAVQEELRTLEEPKKISPYNGALILSEPLQTSQDFEYLALKRKYSATTQNAWNEIDWNKKLNHCIQSEENAPIRSVPDPIAKSNEISRFYPSACHWQKLGNTWDYFQSRKIQDKSEFISTYKRNNRVGYLDIKFVC